MSFAQSESWTFKQNTFVSEEKKREINFVTSSDKVS